ncbi:ANTAR domain-containing protein [Streptomyces sp. HNM0575]|uniref:ANTAR domain-containing protein n=1 Tax=Streptomyces sp. HNM0575 TaxID=2716338 RepID=UPI00145F64A5|nr:ANTAR domain-containing protein [Streptomyces sp. HNM0575]NLU75255.1 ANTAR domain-containing protein [Streptomyces sp. HNM0575]
MGRGLEDDDRRRRLWSHVVERAQGGKITIGHVCAALTAVAGADSAAVTVMLSASPRETIYASSQMAADMEELAQTLGEGPGVDACAGGPALVSDLNAAECQVSWPVFAPAAVAAGVRALFALPLRLGGVGLGVMCLYRSRAGSLSSEQLADALVLADTALALLLDMGQDEGLARGERWSELVGPLHPEVHQATGMLIEQLGVSAGSALLRLRAYAFASERRLRDVARDVVARRLQLDGSEPPPERSES